MRRKFTREEKIEAIRRLESGELENLNPKMVRRWRDEWHQFGANAFLGYGKARARGPQKTEPLIFRLTPTEYEHFLARVESSGARTLSEFARSQLQARDPDPREIERRIADLTLAVRRLARAVAGT